MQPPENLRLTVIITRQSPHFSSVVWIETTKGITMSEKPTPSTPISRRSFVKGTAALAAASTFTIVKPQSVRGSQANSMVEIGWVGCGGQGTRDASLLEATKGAKIVAVADYFQDQTDKARTKFQVDAKRAHVGVDAYKAVINSDVDAVLLVTPPGFRPEHFKAAVNAKKHIFAEKPLAVDVSGCRSVAADGEKAKAQNLSVVVGLQRHYSKAYRKCKELIDGGAIGDVIMTHSAWDTDEIWKDRRGKRADWPSQMDYEVRYWYFFKWLSGDHIVEQSIHNIDVVSWMLNAHPTKASGIGGRYIKRDIGNIWDHFNIAYEYPNGVLANHTCVQIDGVRPDVSETIRGTKGTFTTTAGKGGTGGARIEGVRGRKDPETPVIYKYEGTDDKHYDQEAEAFVKSVKGEGEHRDDTKYGVESTFTTILGREAAYQGGTITWDKLWNSGDKLSFKG
ncbi:MAG: Gfo/Idh/MocA family oxidoreductase [Acidobacteriota bacterium]|nr:Gfo/Idh/MocA family oxidoreductase [Acidobacteriota bacterium]